MAQATSKGGSARYKELAGAPVAEDQVTANLDKLYDYGGFDVLSSTVEGAENMEPGSIMKEIYLTEEANAPDRESLKQRLAEYLTLLSGTENVGEMIETAQGKQEQAEQTLKTNAKALVERTAKLENSYRTVAAFFRNAVGDNKIKNLTVVNASLEKLQDLDSPVFLQKINEELQEKFDRLDLVNSYGLVVVPGFLGSKSVVDEWARTAHDAKAMLVTDFRNLDSADNVMKLWELGKFTGADEHKANVMMTCNWLVGRPAYDDLGERQPMYLPPSSAVAGRMYSNNIAQVSAGKKFGVLRGVEGTRFVTRASELSDLGDMGLVPMAFEYGQVQAFSQRTLNNSANLGLQTYSVVRTFDWLTKSLMDFLNRNLFSNISSNNIREIHQQVAKFFYTCQQQGILEKYSNVEVKKDPRQKDRVLVKIHATPFFPARNFVINLEGKSGDEAGGAPTWEASVADA